MNLSGRDKSTPLTGISSPRFEEASKKIGWAVFSSCPTSSVASFITNLPSKTSPLWTAWLNLLLQMESSLHLTFPGCTSSWLRLDCGTWRWDFSSRTSHNSYLWRQPHTSYPLHVMRRYQLVITRIPCLSSFSIQSIPLHIQPWRILFRFLLSITFRPTSLPDNKHLCWYLLSITF